MNILYAIQGTGNGHLSRALDIIPALERLGRVHLLVSGIQADVPLPYPIAHRYHGLSFIFGTSGGVDIGQSLRRSRPIRLLRDIFRLRLDAYDLLINDFEPVSAWAARLQGRTLISLSHQAAVLHPAAPRPAYRDPVAEQILRHYAPATFGYGFHFQRFGPEIFTPVIRRQIREARPQRLPHITVYLPAYDDARLLQALRHYPQIRWQVFSKHNRQAYAQGHIDIFPVQNEAFVQSLVSGEGVLCGAGFETPAEALFLSKKLMVIPMRGQYEQHCNAAALATMGVPVLPSLPEGPSDLIRHWLESDWQVSVHYPDETQEILNRLAARHAST